MASKTHRSLTRFARPLRIRLFRLFGTSVTPALALLLATTLFALAACGRPAAATSTPPPKATATPAVLFQADWSHGLEGWNASAGWSMVNGAPQSDTSDDRSLTIPFQPKTADYAVEIDLQLVEIPRDGGFYTLNADPTAALSGFRAGIYSLRKPGVARPNGDHPTISTNIDPLDAQDPSGLANSVKDFEPADGVQTYRVVVQGSAALLSVDGRFYTSAASTQSKHLSTGPLHFKCGGVALRITGLRILSL